MDVALKARWCRRFAELNYIALRKIAKKRDRLLGGSVGEEFMQVSIQHSYHRMLHLLLPELIVPFVRSRVWDNY